MDKILLDWFGLLCYYNYRFELQRLFVLKVGYNYA